MEFRAAGISDPEVIRMERFKNITFLGKLNKEQMLEEYLSAEAFVLPTLSEGMSGVVIEAISGGCPVITTKAAGIDTITDGVNGVIVPLGDVNALTIAIERIYKDREFRRNISNNTKHIVNQYTMKSWKERLEIIIKETYNKRYLPLSLPGVDNRSGLYKSNREQIEEV